MSNPQSNEQTISLLHRFHKWYYSESYVNSEGDAYQIKICDTCGKEKLVWV